MRRQRKLHNISNQNTEQENEVYNGQGCANVEGTYENSNQEETEYDNIDGYVINCTNCGNKFQVKKEN